uniref:Uncharacterized protein n=1 Tax=Knipowitschia caucasica TaxID=637954 RepID=A0AAV2KMW9_KNICA
MNRKTRSQPFVQSRKENAKTKPRLTNQAEGRHLELAQALKSHNTHAHTSLETCGPDLDYRAAQTEKVCGLTGALPCLSPHPQAPTNRHIRPIHTSIEEHGEKITKAPGPSSPCPSIQLCSSLILHTSCTVPAPGRPDGHSRTLPHSRLSIGSRFSHAASCHH